jgi:hypothetical protein
MKRTRLPLRTPEEKARARGWIDKAPVGWSVEFRPPLRTLPQNAHLWATLDDIAEQVDWYGQKLTSEEWKDVCTAALKQQRVVPGIDGGFVVIGAHTSQMSVEELSDLLELARAFGSERGVKWGDELDSALITAALVRERDGAAARLRSRKQ